MFFNALLLHPTFNTNNMNRLEMNHLNQDDLYVSPSAEILELHTEGVLCSSDPAGNESLGENDGDW